MAQSLSNIVIHLTFSTQQRMPLITDDIREELNAYLCGILRNHHCPSIRVNTASDHAHLLFQLGSTVTSAFVIEEIKRGSSKWIKSKGPRWAGFYWQHGYAAFSVSPEDIPAVSAYIARQQEHHQQVSFAEEVRALCRKHGVTLDERFFLA